MKAAASRRSFIKAMGMGAAAMGMANASAGQAPPKIQGFEEEPADPNVSKSWKPVSDREIRVGIVGYGVCRFGAAFSFQDHPNVEVAAVSDLFPNRCRALAEARRCERSYPSLEEMGKDDSTSDAVDSGVLMLCAGRGWHNRRFRRISRTVDPASADV